MNRFPVPFACSLTTAAACLLALALPVSVPSASAITGGASLDSSDLVGGEFRALALVQLAQGTCSGALVAPDLVLTAAHCETPTSVQVNGGTFAVTETHVAAGFSPTSFSSDHDLALLRLDGTVATQPMRFATAAGEIGPGTEVTFAGFGLEGSLDTAAVGAGEVGVVEARTFDFSGRATTCLGDSGGPVIAGGTIVGVISAGVGGADCFDSTIATRVSAQSDFLASFMNIEPVAASDTATIFPGGRTTLTLRARDTAGERITFSVLDPGIFTLGRGCNATDTGPDASVKCTITAPKNAAVGTSSEVVFRASDGRASSIGTIEVNVLRRASGNVAPSASDAAVEVEPGGVVSFTLPAFDADGDPLTSRIRTGPASGNIDCQGLECDYYSNLQTSAAPGETDSFSYTVNDGKRTSNTATVNITMVANRAPVFLDPDRTITGYSGVTFLERVLVSEVQGEKVTVSAVDPSFVNDIGTVIMTCSDDHEGTQFQPIDCLIEASPGFSGVAEFQLAATDGIDVVHTSFNVHVNANQAPSITGETFTLTPEDDFRFPLQSPFDNPDPDCAAAAFDYPDNAYCEPFAYTIEIDTSGASGDFTCNTDGASEFNGYCSFEPAEGAAGDQVVIVRWSISDGAASSRTVTTKVTYRFPPA